MKMAATRSRFSHSRTVRLQSVALAALVATSPALRAQSPALLRPVVAAGVPALPDAPEPQAAHPENDARITGAVSDSTGALVPGAVVTLREEGKTAPNRTVNSDNEGRFTFTGLPAGEYTLDISAPGLERLEWPRITLRAGEHHEVPDIALPVARNNEEVSVTVTRKDLATEELKIEEHQRVFGVFPNFYTSFQPNAAPLDTVQKFSLAAHATLDPVAFGTTGIVAGIEQLHNTFPDYGKGPAGYGKRYGAAYGDAFIGKFIGSALLPSVFRQDPRYFYMGTGTNAARARHAILSSVLAKHDNNGRWEPNYSHILGNAAAGAISTLYHPDSNGTGELAARNALIGVAGGAAVNLVREFLLKPFTHGLPPTAPKP